MTLSDWELAQVTVDALRAHADKIMSIERFDARYVRAALALRACAKAIEAVDPPFNAEQLQALVYAVAAGVDEILSNP